MHNSRLLKATTLLLCLGTPIALWIWYDKSIKEWYPISSERGLYGDGFGGLNALFSGLSAGAVVFTLFLTYLQLRLAHDQNKKSSEAIREGQSEIAAQTKMLAEQLGELVPQTHRVTAAENNLEISEVLHSQARSSLENAILFVPQEHQADVLAALEKSDRRWEQHLDGILDFSAAASPSPSGSTSALGASISIRAQLTEERARQLGEWAQWILTNYRR